MKKKNILVLDTETAGSLSYPFIYDLGFIVYDTYNKKVLDKKSIILDDIFNNKELMETAYYMEKLPKYREDIEKGLHEVKTIKEAFNSLSNTIKKYSIKEIYTYTFFDLRAINHMINFYKLNFNLDNLKFFDIRAYAIKSLFNDNYKEFCKTNNFITEKGFYMTTAEVVGRYIMNDTSFIEEHTALSDCKLELNILVSCINEKLNYGDKLPSVRTNDLKVKGHIQTDSLFVDGIKKLEIEYTSKREYRKNNTIHYKTKK